MKYRKFAGLLAMGSLIAPTVLSTEKVFAEDVPVASTSQVAPQTTQSTTNATSTVASTTSASEKAADSTSEATAPAEATTAPASSSSEAAVSTSRSEVQKYQLTVNDTPLSQATYTDDKGNEVTFERYQDVEAGALVKVDLHLANNYEVDTFEAKTTTGDPVNLTLGPTSGMFVMPAGDVAFHVTFKEKPATPSIPSDSSSSSSTSSSTTNEMSTTTSESSSSASSTTNPNSSTTSNSSNSTQGSQSQSTHSSSSSASTTNEQPNNSTEPSTGHDQSGNNQGTANPGNNSSSGPVTVPNNNAGRQPAGTADDIKVPSNDAVPEVNNDVRQALVKEAYQHLGKAYVWGAKGPNTFDCSGLTHYIYAKVTGHEIGGWTGDQQYSGTQIPVSEAQPGDLLFWGALTSVTSHVAIYIGNGQYIHAPQPGDVVKITNLSDFMPTFAVRVNVAGLSQASSSSLGSIGSGITGSDDEGGFHFSKNQTTDEFIKKVGDLARNVGQEHDIYASVMIAQAILESGSGNSALASEPNHNLFGIKGKFQGKGVTFSTLEQDEGGKNYQIQAEFRKYPSYKESLEDYAELLKDGISGNKNYYKPTWKSETSSFKDATKYLQGRYATDKKYAEKLDAIIDTYNLTDYDHQKADDISLMSHKKTTQNKIGPSLEELNTTFVLDDVLKTKLITDITIGPKLPKMLSTRYFVDLFRGDSLIELAATSAKAQRRHESELPANSPIYIALSKSLMAILPPVE